MSEHFGAAPRQGASPWLGKAVIGLALLAVLAYVGVRQADFNPAVKAAGELRRTQAAPGGADGLAWERLLPPELIPLSPAESFGPDTLYHKIDGKADLYLGAGFRSLVTRRLALKDDPAAWCELFVYDQGDAKGAFAVHSQQRRADARPLDLAEHAYRSGHYLFLAQGPYYQELVAAGDSPALAAAMARLAAGFFAAHAPREAAGAAPSDGRRAFPSAGADPAGPTLLARDAFGCQALDQVLALAYRREGGEATAFLSRRVDPGEAAALAGAYRKFLASVGGGELPAPGAPEGATLHDLLGAYEVVFTRGAFLAGVHEAPDQATALALAAELARGLAGERP